VGTGLDLGRMWSMSLEDGAGVDRYVEAALGADGAGIGVDELLCLLESTFEWGSFRLRLLTALQSAVDRADEDSSAGQLKGALTNLIIMQSRIREREDGLAEMLRQAEGESAVGPVMVAADELRGFAESVLGASRHVQGAADA
jgi:hypothetical protein